MLSARSRQARQLFAGIARSYERVAAVLSLGQDARWRAALVRLVAARPGERVLDVATGTGLVGRALVARYGCRVIGLDQSDNMLCALRGLPVVQGQAERLPFATESFDHVTFTYLLRYVDDPAATLTELARVLRPGGRLAAIEFGVPENLFWRCLWRLYTRVGLPLAGRAISPGWLAVGAFLGPSIERFYAAHPQAAIEEYWCATGLEDLRVQRLSLGGGTLMSATKGLRPNRSAAADESASAGETTAAPAVTRTAPAFYALAPGGWRDYWTLLHPPYTAWHLSYVLLGAALAPAPDPRVVLGALVAFGLAVGVGAHAFDELQGRPLGTRIPGVVLAGLGFLALGVSAALGVAASMFLGRGLLVFVVFGVLLVLGYGFEIKPVHSDLGFAFAWGGFPVVVAAYAVGAPPLPTAVAAAGATLLSLAQRRLSTRVRAVRRRASEVTGQIAYRDGSREAIDAPALIAVPEAGLQLLWLAAVLISGGALAARWL